MKNFHLLVLFFIISLQASIALNEYTNVTNLVATKVGEDYVATFDVSDHTGRELVNTTWWESASYYPLFIHDFDLPKSWTHDTSVGYLDSKVPGSGVAPTAVGLSIDSGSWNSSKCKKGGCYYFPSTSNTSYLVFDDDLNPLTNDRIIKLNDSTTYSFEYWIAMDRPDQNVEVNTVYHVPVGYIGNNNSFTMHYILGSSSAIQIRFMDDSRIIYTNPVITGSSGYELFGVYNWAHITWVFVPGQVKVYYNGVETHGLVNYCTYVNSTGQTTVVPLSTGACVFRDSEMNYTFWVNSIGKGYPGTTVPGSIVSATYSGFIDEVRLYNYALTQEQAYNHYNLSYNKLDSSVITENTHFGQELTWEVHSIAAPLNRSFSGTFLPVSEQNYSDSKSFDFTYVPPSTPPSGGGGSDVITEPSPTAPSDPVFECQSILCIRSPVEDPIFVEEPYEEIPIEEIDPFAKKNITPTFAINIKDWFIVSPPDSIYLDDLEMTNLKKDNSSVMLSFTIVDNETNANWVWFVFNKNYLYREINNINLPPTKIFALHRYLPFEIRVPRTVSGDKTRLIRYVVTDRQTGYFVYLSFLIKTEPDSIFDQVRFFFSKPLLFSIPYEDIQTGNTVSLNFRPRIWQVLVSSFVIMFIISIIWTNKNFKNFRGSLWKKISKKRS